MNVSAIDEQQVGQLSGMAAKRLKIERAFIHSQPYGVGARADLQLRAAKQAISIQCSWRPRIL